MIFSTWMAHLTLCENARTFHRFSVIAQWVMWILSIAATAVAVTHSSLGSGVIAKELHLLPPHEGEEREFQPMLKDSTVKTVLEKVNLSVIIIPIMLALIVTINSRMKWRDKWSVCITAADYLASEIYKFRLMTCECKRPAHHISRLGSASLSHTRTYMHTAKPQPHSQSCICDEWEFLVIMGLKLGIPHHVGLRLRIPHHMGGHAPSLCVCLCASMSVLGGSSAAASVTHILVFSCAMRTPLAHVPWVLSCFHASLFPSQPCFHASLLPCCPPPPCSSMLSAGFRADPVCADDLDKPPGKDEDGNDLPPLSQKEKSRRARMLFVDRVQAFQAAALTEISQSAALKPTKTSQATNKKVPPSQRFLDRQRKEEKPTLAQCVAALSRPDP